ncbi:hypothetical protein EOPP23_20135 [Endozoicomonas sp. OPT23]|nr:hypothetical protein [Endozoicomonas sp. OPT23]
MTSPKSASANNPRVILSSPENYLEGTRATYSCSAADSVGSRWYFNGTRIHQATFNGSSTDVACINGSTTNSITFFFNRTNVGIDVVKVLPVSINNTLISCEAEFPPDQTSDTTYYIPSGNNKTLRVFSFEAIKRTTLDWLTLLKTGLVDNSQNLPDYERLSTKELLQQSCLMPANLESLDSGSLNTESLTTIKNLPATVALLLQWTPVFIPDLPRWNYPLRYYLVIENSLGEILTTRKTTDTSINVEVPLKEAICHQLEVRLTPAYFSSESEDYIVGNHPTTRMSISVRNIPIQAGELLQPGKTPRSDWVMNLDSSDNTIPYTLVFLNQKDELISINTNSSEYARVENGQLKVSALFMQLIDPASLMVVTYQAQPVLSAREEADTPSPNYLPSDNPFYISMQGFTCPEETEESTETMAPPITAAISTHSDSPRTNAPTLVTVHSNSPDLKSTYWVEAVIALVMTLSFSQ